MGNREPPNLVDDPSALGAGYSASELQPARSAIALRADVALSGPFRLKMVGLREVTRQNQAGRRQTGAGRASWITRCILQHAPNPQ